MFKLPNPQGLPKVSSGLRREHEGIIWGRVPLKPYHDWAWNRAAELQSLRANGNVFARLPKVKEGAKWKATESAPTIAPTFYERNFAKKRKR